MGVNGLNPEDLAKARHSRALYNILLELDNIAQELIAAKLDTDGKDAADGYAGLDGSGKLLPIVIPALLISQVAGFSALYQTADYTLGNVSTSQKFFNSTAAGAITLAANKRYRFIWHFRVSVMSAVSGNAKLDVLGAGTATIASCSWHIDGMDGTTPSSGANASQSFQTATISPGNVFTGGVGTGMWGTAQGSVVTGAGGTIIPSVALTTAIATAQAMKDSFFEIWEVGADTVAGVGNAS
jgi:hypothetical protein